MWCVKGRCLHSKLTFRLYTCRALLVTGPRGNVRCTYSSVRLNIPEEVNLEKVSIVARADRREPHPAAGPSARTAVCTYAGPVGG